MNPDLEQALRELPGALTDLASKIETSNIIALSELETARGQKEAAGNLLRMARARMGVNISGERT